MRYVCTVVLEHDPVPGSPEHTAFMADLPSMLMTGLLEALPDIGVHLVDVRMDQRTSDDGGWRSHLRDG